MSTVEASVVECLKIADGAMTQARQILRKGPMNQVFATQAGRGEGIFWSYLMCTLEKYFPAIQAARQAGAEPVADYVALTDYFASEGLAIDEVLGAAVPAGNMLGKLGFYAAVGSGLCQHYGGLALLGALEELERRQVHFDADLRLAELAEPPQGPRGRWNSIHMAATLSIRVDGKRPEKSAVVMMDPWVEHARPVLMPETRYAQGRRPWTMGSETVSIQRTADGQVSAWKWHQIPGGKHLMHELNVKQLPRLSELKKLAGRCSLPRLWASLQRSHAAARTPEDACRIAMLYMQLADQASQTSAAFSPRLRTWQTFPRILADWSQYHLERVPGTQRGRLYRSPSGNREFDAMEKSFPRLPNILSVEDRQIADQHALTIDPPPDHLA